MSLLLGGRLFAQPQSVGSGGASSEATFGFSYSPSADLERDGRAGEAEVRQFGFGYTLAMTTGSDFRLSLGVFGSDTDLGLSGGAPLPDKLRLIGLTLGVRKSLADELGQAWSLMAMVRPNLTSESGGFSDAGFNAPAMLSLGYRASPALTWDFGVMANPEGEYPVLPLVGFRWEFAPRWLASLGFPRTGVSYKASSAVTWRVGASFQGGTYRVRLPDHGDLKGKAWLDYRDLRLGIGVDYAVATQLTLGLEAGAVVDRRFEYFDRDYQIDGASGSFVGISLTGRF